MQTANLLDQIDSMIVEEKIVLIEKTIKSLKRDLKDKSYMAQAVKDLREDYLADSELIAFTDLDAEEFYETR
ncbi:hypothetical protein ACFLSQ_07200 [Bacteroidota bacterium]